MDKTGIREYQRSIKQLKQEMDFIKHNPNLSLLGTSKQNSKEITYSNEDKENHFSYLNQTVTQGESSIKKNYRSNSSSVNQEKHFYTQKYDQSIISLEEKMQSIKQNFVDKKKQELIQAQHEMDQVMLRMKEVEREENILLQEKIRKINERFEESSQLAKVEYEQKLLKYKESMEKDIEKEKERTQNSIALKFKNLESSINQSGSSSFSSSLKKYSRAEDSSSLYDSFYNQKITHVSQIKPSISVGQTHFATQEDTVGKNSTSLQSDRFTSNKRESNRGQQDYILQQDGHRNIFNQQTTQRLQRSKSNSSCSSSSSDLDERFVRKSNNKSNQKQITSNHPIHKIIESNYKMNNKEIFSLIKKYKKINQSYEQPSSTYSEQQMAHELQSSKNQRQQELEKNFVISRKLSYQDDPTAVTSASQTPSSQSNNIQFQFHTQQTQPTSNAQNSLNTSYSNSLIDNFQFISHSSTNNNNKRKSSNSFHSTTVTPQYSNFVKPVSKNMDFYQTNQNKDTSFQFKPPLNSRKSSISNNSNNNTSRIHNSTFNHPSTINGKYYLSSSVNRKSSNATTQAATKRSITNQIQSQSDISDDSF